MADGGQLDWLYDAEIRCTNCLGWMPASASLETPCPHCGTVPSRDQDMLLGVGKPMCTPSQGGYLHG